MKVISSNPRRNMQQVVLHNTDASGRKASVTRHIPIDDSRFVTYANHGFVAKAGKYRQPSAAR
jgi:hypothetical protein